MIDNKINAYIDQACPRNADHAANKQ